MLKFYLTVLTHFFAFFIPGVVIYTIHIHYGKDITAISITSICLAFITAFGYTLVKQYEELGK